MSADTGSPRVDTSRSSRRRGRGRRRGSHDGVAGASGERGVSREIDEEVRLPTWIPDTSNCPCSNRMTFFFGKNEFPVNDRTVLITGGSKGMGRSVARQLAEKGANVIIVARDVARLHEAASYISEGAASPKTQRFHYISGDLTTASESVRIISEATAFNENAPPDIVWCCAGSSYPTLFIDTPVAEIKNQVDSNYLTSAYMAHATLRAWLKAPSKTPATICSGPLLPRHLIFTASFLSFFTLAGFAPYSPTKAALRSLSDTLSQEMNLYASSSPNKPEVRIHTIFPATIYTESYEAENRVKSDVTKKLEEGDAGQTPDEVAKRSIAGLERGDELVTTTFLTRLVMTSTLGGSIRNGWAVLDTVLSWVMSVVMVFVRWDTDVKVRRWGRENGESGMKRAPRQ